MEPMKKKKANSFGVFLDSVNQKDVRPSLMDYHAMASISQSGEARAETQILGLLAHSTGPLSVKSIIERLELAPSITMTTLSQLATAGLVKMSRTTKDEKVAITELGRKLT